MVFRHVIFDWDGTIVNSEYEISRITAELAAGFGARLSAMDVFQGCAGRGSRAKFNWIAQRCGMTFDKPTYDYLREQHRLRKQALYTDDAVEVIEGAPAMFAALKERGCLMSVASNTETALLEEAVKKTGLAAYFNGRVYGPDKVGGVQKPDPALFRFTVEDSGIDASATAVVGDSPVDMAAARAAGLCAVAYINPLFGEGESYEARRAEMTQSGADYCIRSYDDFLALSLPG